MLRATSVPKTASISPLLSPNKIARNAERSCETKIPEIEGLRRRVTETSVPTSEEDSLFMHTKVSARRGLTSLEHTRWHKHRKVHPFSRFYNLIGLAMISHCSKHLLQWRIQTIKVCTFSVSSIPRNASAIFGVVFNFDSSVLEFVQLQEVQVVTDEKDMVLFKVEDVVEGLKKFILQPTFHHLTRNSKTVHRNRKIHKFGYFCKKTKRLKHQRTKSWDLRDRKSLQNLEPNVHGTNMEPPKKKNMYKETLRNQSSFKSVFFYHVMHFHLHLSKRLQLPKNWEH